MAGSLYDLFMLIFSPQKQFEKIVTNFRLVGRVFPSKCTIHRKKVSNFQGASFLNSKRTAPIWLGVATRFHINKIKDTKSSIKDYSLTTYKCEHIQHTIKRYCRRMVEYPLVLMLLHMTLI